MEKVAFIGLGAMGRPMAANLLTKGWPVTVFNRTRDKAEGLPAACTVAPTVADAAKGADAVITMLADDKATEDVAFDLDGILANLPAGGIHVAMSTIGVACSRRLAEAHAAIGQGYLAAPVFGRPDAAAAGTLWIVAGGPPDVLERCRPLLDAMGQGVFHVSEAAEGANVVKLAGNFTIAAMLQTLSEAFALVGKHGLDPQQFLDIVNGTLFRSPLYETYGGLCLNQGSEPGFTLRLGLKDVSLVLAAGAGAAVPMPSASLVRDTLLSGMARGLGEEDWTALARVVTANAGLPVSS